MKTSSIFILNIVLLLSACASQKQYAGPDRPASEIAIVYMEKQDHLSVYGIDGKRRGVGNIQRFEFLPGKHTINVVYIASNVQGLGSVTITDPMELSFKAEAGNVYQIKREVRFKPFYIEAWIENTKTDKIVSEEMIENIENIQTQPQPKKEGPEMFLKKGDEYLNKEDEENAKICYIKAIELDPTFAPAMMKLGVLAFEEFDYEVAREYFLKAIGVDPEYEEFRDIYEKYSNKAPIKWDALPPPPEGSRVRFIPFDEPPKPLSPIRPKYPEVAREAGLEGTVQVQVFVDKNGQVIETVILKGIPNSGLDEAAIQAIRSTKFIPAKQRDRNFGVWISIPINFNLKNTK